jgi:hypothetical protein
MPAFPGIGGEKGEGLSNVLYSIMHHTSVITNSTVAFWCLFRVLLIIWWIMLIKLMALQVEN